MIINKFLIEYLILKRSIKNQMAEKVEIFGNYQIKFVILLDILSMVKNVFPVSDMGITEGYSV